MKTIHTYFKQLVPEGFERIRKIQGNPKPVALGISIEIFLDFFHFFVLKTILAITFAWLMGANKTAAATGS